MWNVQSLLFLDKLVLFWVTEGNSFQLIDELSTSFTVCIILLYCVLEIGSL